MFGGNGSNTYYVDNVGDYLEESFGRRAMIRVYAGVSLTLGAFLKICT